MSAVHKWYGDHVARALTVSVAFAAAALSTGCGRRAQVQPLIHETEPVVAVRVPGRMNSSEPCRLLIVLHGHDQTEDQFIDLWNWGFFYQPNFTLASIRAPFKAKGGYSWTASVRSYRDVPEAARLARFAATAEARIMAQIDTLRERYNIDPDEVYIAGASQGAAIAAHLFFKHTDIFAGLGLIVGNMERRLSKPPAGGELNGTPVFLSVGKGEGDVIVEAMEATESLLAEAGADVRFYLHPKGHVITQPVIRALQNQLGLSLTDAPEVECVEISPGRFGDERPGEQIPPAYDEFEYDDE